MLCYTKGTKRTGVSAICFTEMGCKYQLPQSPSKKGGKSPTFSLFPLERHHLLMGENDFSLPYSATSLNYMHACSRGFLPLGKYVTLKNDFMSLPKWPAWLFKGFLERHSYMASMMNSSLSRPSLG